MNCWLCDRPIEDPPQIIGHWTDQAYRPWPSREPCRQCGSMDGVLWPRNGQNVVSCNDCGAWIYNAPKTETGEEPRTVATLRKGLRPSQQARLTIRDNGMCIACGSRDHLTIAHFISVADAVEFGVPEVLLESDFNKALMCEADNSGLNRLSVPARFIVAWLLRLEGAHQNSLIQDELA